MFDLCIKLGIRTIGLAVLFLASVSVRATAAVMLPVEVLGPDGFTQSVQVNAPSVNSGQGTYLWLQMNGLEYDTEASVQVNNGAWMPLSNHTVTLQGMGGAYGGIGGGFSRLTMTIALPVSLVAPGQNTIKFRFNGTDGNSSGFRVLAFNLQQPLGKNLISSSQFVQDNPAAWRAPSTNAADISAGQTLWRTATLKQPSPGSSPHVLKAHCMDCHAQDGRDLKYFNYSNQSIEARAAFHGLTAAQGLQIASYIRSLNLPAPGRPWDPPYQPGAGMDSKPVNQWAAGAGLNAQLASDAAMLPSLAPGGNMANWAATRTLNARETPIAVQLPDWNMWLPRVHPMDGFGSAFTSSQAYTLYGKIRSALRPNDESSYSAEVNNSDFDMWSTYMNQFLAGYNLGSVNWTPALRTEVYSAVQWELVKSWEINQEFGLEAMASVPYGGKAEKRAWYSNVPFFTSPNMQHIPSGPGLANGSDVARTYLSLIWYQLQLVLNAGNGQEHGSTPIDFGYVFGFVKDISNASHKPQSMLQMLWAVKSLQEETASGVGPEQGSDGWQPSYTSPEYLVDPNWQAVWSATSSATRASVMQGYLKAWFAQIQTYTPRQFYDGGWTSQNENPAGSNPGDMGQNVWYMIPRFRYWGVDPNLTNQIADWAKGVWPKANWNSTKTATCYLASDTVSVRCTSD